MKKRIWLSGIFLAALLLAACSGGTAAPSGGAPGPSGGTTPAPPAAPSGGGSAAESYPGKAITLYVPFAVGGGADLTARTVASVLPKYLGQSIVIENKPGGNGAVAHGFFKDLPADGYSLCISGQSPVTLTPLIEKVDYDPLEDFVYICRVIGLSDMVAVRGDSPFNTIQEMIEYSKTHPGEVTCSNAGANGVSYYLVEAINKTTGAQLVNVAFNGASEAVTATLSGDAKAYFGSLSAALSLVESGEFRILAFNSQKDEKYPDVPTLLESNIGVDFAPGNYLGLIAPAGTPGEIVKKIDDAVRQMVQDDGFINMCKNLSLPIVYLNTEDMNKATLEEIEMCRKIVELTLN